MRTSCAAAQPCSAAHSRTPASPTEHSLRSVHGFCRHSTHFRLSCCPSVPEDENAAAASCWEEGGGQAGLFAESCGTVRCSAPLSLCRGKDRGAGTAWPCFPCRFSELSAVPLFSCLGWCRGRAAVSGEVSLAHSTGLPLQPYPAISCPVPKCHPSSCPPSPHSVPHARASNPTQISQVCAARLRKKQVRKKGRGFVIRERKRVPILQSREYWSCTSTHLAARLKSWQE